MPVGSDETIDIAIRARYEGIEKAIGELKRLGSQLTSIDKQLRSGLNSDVLNKQFAETVRQFDRVSNAVKTGSADSSKSIANVTSQVQRLSAELKKAQASKGIGFMGAKTDPKGFKQFQESMNNIGTPVMGGAKSFGMLVRNMRNLNTSLNDTSKSGIATRASLDAVQNGGSIAFMPALDSSEKLKVKLKSLRANIEGVTQSMQTAAKDRQWIGRQMIEGITLPIVGLGTIAVRSFMSVQSEMIQLKKVTEFGAAEASADKFYDSLVNGTNGIRKMSREFGIGRKAATSLFKDVAALGVDGEENIKSFANAVSEVAMVGDVDTDTAMQFFRTMNAIFAGGKTNTEGLAETRDLMAQMSAVADETSLQLKDLAAAFPEVAPVMNQMGFSAAGVAASLAGMYKRGIPATEAAHGLKFALQRLVSPTKDSAELIDKMGFSFFDASGKIKKADVEIMALAKNLSPENMSAEASSKAMGELFGLRQTARMQSFFQDVNIGRKELEAYTAGTMKAADMTSDYARGLVAAGFGVKGAIGPINRYNKALEEIKKDPTTGLKRLKAAFDDFKVQLGATIAPALLQFGQFLTKILDGFTNLPAPIQIAVIAAAGFLSVLGPIYFMSGQVTHALAAMGKMASKVLPKMLDMGAAASRAFISDGGREMVQVGNRTVDNLSRADRRRFKLGLPTSAQKVIEDAGTASSLAPETAATAGLTSAKEALEAASVSVAAAETAEIAAHNGNTAAMTAQTVATKKKSIADAVSSGGSGNKNKYRNPIQQAIDLKKQVDAEKLLNQQLAQRVIKFNSMGTPIDAATGKILSLKDAQRSFTDAQKIERAGAAVNDPIAKYQAMKNKIDEVTKSTENLAAKTAKTKPSMPPWLAAMEKQRLSKLPLPPTEKAGGIMSKVSGIGSKLAGLGSSIATIAAVGATVLLVLAAIAIAAGVVFIFFKAFRDNWDAFVKALQPGVEAIKKSFKVVQDAVGNLVSVFTKIFSQLGTAGTKGEETGNAVVGIGEMISTAMEYLAKGFEIVATVIGFLQPLIEKFAYMFKDMVGLVVSLMKGDWTEALKYAAAFFYENFVRSILQGIDILAKGLAQGFSTVLSIIINLAKKVSNISVLGYKPFGFLTDGVISGLQDAQNAIEGFSDKGFLPAVDGYFRTGLGGVFGDAGNDPNGDAKKAGTKLGNTVGEGINDGVGDSAGGGSWVNKWIEKVVSQIDKQLDKVRKSATDALEKAQEAALKVYDDRIKAIEDQEKAEEKLYKTEEYLAKKRDLLAKRNLDSQNYQKEKALAIYEGRYNDARMLDVQEQVNKREYAKDLTDIEDSRSKDLLKEVRDGLKEQITAEKEAAKTKFDIQKQSFEDYLDVLAEMTPVTVEQFQTMMDQINGVLQQNGATWPGYAETAMSRMGEALRKANRDVINEFNRSENNPLLQWVASFAEPEVIKILKAGLEKAGGGGGGGGGSGGTGDGSGITPDAAAAPAPEDTGMSFEEQQKKYKNTRLAFDPNLHNVGGERAANEKFDVRAKDQSQQNLIDMIKEQIKRGDERNKGLEEYTIALQQIKADAYAAYHTMSDEEGKAHTQSMKNIREKLVGQDAVFSGDNRAVGSIRKMTDEVKFHTDKSGIMYEQVGDRMVDSFGRSFKILKDEHGNMTGNIVDNNGKIIKINEKTFTTAQSLLQEMMDKGIKPGTAAAADYIAKINDLGSAVYELDDKFVTVVFSADTAKLYEAIKRINDFAKLNFANGGFVGDITETFRDFNSPEAAANYLTPNFAWMNEVELNGKTWRQNKLGLASGGLVEAQKDGIVANIGEGGFDEYVITTDPKYRASNLGYLSAAASKLGVKMASGAAMKAASGGAYKMASGGAYGMASGGMVTGSGSSAEYASNMGGDVYISVDTFIGEEEWFASMAGKYNMKTLPRQRKIEGQQKRVVSSYNDRYRLR